jgi:hypothetical protein
VKSWIQKGLTKVRNQTGIGSRKNKKPVNQVEESTGKANINGKSDFNATWHI